MGKKILLADDSITIQKVIELTFSDEDFDVITVGNGRLALERLAEVRPDIVLCDIIMPEKDGYEVCEQIKTNPAHSHIPVLLLTGAFEPFDQERAARAGYDGSLAKPFEPETLIAKVKDLLARAPVRAAAPPLPPARPVTAPPVAVAPPAVLPFARPAAAPPLPPPTAPRPAPSAPPSFIPDEPFGALGDSAFPDAPAEAPLEAFAPMTEEESATLLAPPAEVPAPADAASTVMFRAADLPWNAPPVPAAAPPPAFVAPPPAPEPVFVPEPVEVVEAAEEAPVFEEVLEEDLDFGATSFEPVPADESGTAQFAPEMGTLPPLPPESEEGAATGAFSPVPGDEPAVPAVEPVFEEEPAPAPVPFEPEAVLEAEPAPAFEPEPEPAPAFEPEPTAAFEPEPAPVFEAGTGGGIRARARAGVRAGTGGASSRNRAGVRAGTGGGIRARARAGVRAGTRSRIRAGARARLRAGARSRTGRECAADARATPARRGARCARVVRGRGRRGGPAACDSAARVGNGRVLRARGDGREDRPAGGRADLGEGRA